MDILRFIIVENFWWFIGGCAAIGILAGIGKLHQEKEDRETKKQILEELKKRNKDD